MKSILLYADTDGNVSGIDSDGDTYEGKIIHRGEVVYQSKSVGYSRCYASKYDETFGKKEEEMN